MDVRKYLLSQHTETYQRWYDGYMSYSLFSKKWEEYISNLISRVEYTPENYFRSIIDIYAAALTPQPPELSSFHPQPLVQRGEAIAVIQPDGQLNFPNSFELLIEGDESVAAIFTKSILSGVENCIFVWSSGLSELWSRPLGSQDAYKLDSQSSGFSLYPLTLPGRLGLGRSLAPQQDRINHSIIDQAVISEQITRPFWYLLRYQKPIANPYLPQSSTPATEEKVHGEAQRLFTTSSEGPFGQLQPPDLKVMVEAHHTYIERMGQLSAIPSFYLSLSGSEVPSGVALSRISQRFTQSVQAMRQSIEPQLQAILSSIGAPSEEIWPDDTGVVQEALDSHGLALSQMGYPFDYISSVVTPGADLVIDPDLHTE